MAKDIQNDNVSTLIEFIGNEVFKRFDGFTPNYILQVWRVSSQWRLRSRRFHLL